MSVKKGDVVLVAFAMDVRSRLHTKRRPVVVISEDVDNEQRNDVSVVSLTRVKKYVVAAKRVDLAMDSPEGKSSGLMQNCTIDCSVVATVPKSLLVGRIGCLPKQVKDRVDERIGLGY